jgi:hypothetical protein
MAGAGLVELARRYVACADELEGLREQIKLAVVNGEGPPFVKPARASGGSQPNHPNAVKAAEAEAAILELIRSRPGQSSAELARATDTKPNTMVQRLDRMRGRGEVSRGDGGGWQASAAP